MSPDHKWGLVMEDGFEGAITHTLSGYQARVLKQLTTVGFSFNRFFSRRLSFMR